MQKQSISEKVTANFLQISLITAALAQKVQKQHQKLQSAYVMAGITLSDTIAKSAASRFFNTQEDRKGQSRKALTAQLTKAIKDHDNDTVAELVKFQNVPFSKKPDIFKNFVSLMETAIEAENQEAANLLLDTGMIKNQYNAEHRALFTKICVANMDTTMRKITDKHDFIGYDRGQVLRHIAAKGTGIMLMQTLGIKTLDRYHKQQMLRSAIHAKNMVNVSIIRKANVTLDKNDIMNLETFVQQGDQKMVKFMLDEMDINPKTSNNRPIELAKACRDREIWTMLREKAYGDVSPASSWDKMDDTTAVYSQYDAVSDTTIKQVFNTETQVVQTCVLDAFSENAAMVSKQSFNDLNAKEQKMIAAAHKTLKK